MFDYFFFSIDKIIESVVTKGGIISLNSAYYEGTAEEELGDERNVHKRIYGRVVAVPSKFSDMAVTAIDPGSPRPKRYIGGDEIAERIRMGHKNYSKKDYAPTLYEHDEFITIKDIARKTDIQLGDTIYFDYKATDADQKVGTWKGKMIFRVRVDEVLAVVRNGEIITQGGWLFVEPDMETWDEITTGSGIIMKPNPEAKELRGLVKYCNFMEYLKKGDHIVFLPHANWAIKVEGKEIFAMRESEVIGVLEEANGKAS